MKPAAKKAAKETPEWEAATMDPLILGESAPEFQKDGAKRNRLLAILRDPVFREAVAILEDEMKPRGDLAIFLKKPKVAAARFHQQAGLTYLTDGFRRLATEPKTPKAPQPKRLTTELPKS